MLSSVVASLLLVLLCSTGSRFPLPPLPVNPLLTAPVSSVPSLTLPLGSGQVSQTLTPSPMLIVAEGIPPVQTKLVEQMRRWEYVDLAKLLGGQEIVPEEATVVVDGQKLLMEVAQRGQRRQSTISNIWSWLQAYSRYMAVMLSADTTSKEEAAGLAAHMHLILQLSRDLGGTQWLRYDQEFREWAAAKGVKRWGELNLAIYGRCLSLQKTVSSSSNFGRGKYPSSQTGDKRSLGACFKWNDGHCNKPCGFRHICSNCGGPHTRTSCPLRNKRARRD